MKRIAVFGTHGAAKTTLVYKLAAFYKMNDKNVTVIHETARQCPFPINDKTVYQTTLYVVSSQLKKELEAEAEGFEIAISDRTLSDAFIYINFLKRDNNLTKSLQDFCLEWIKQYDMLVYLEPTPGFTITKDGKRACDASYQIAIRDEFRDLVAIVEQKYLKNTIKIIKAESDQIFNEPKCKTLLKEINASLFATVKQEALTSV